MPHVTVHYAWGVVEDIVGVLCKASKDLGYALWSLRGNPCAMPTLRTMAMRICVIDTEAIHPHNIPEESILGTVHVVRVAHRPSKCRVSFHLEDLSGEPLPSADEQAFRLFCERFERFLAMKGLHIPADRGFQETAPIRMPPIRRSDTGPLPA